MGFEMHVGMKISMLLLKEKKYVNKNKEEDPDREETDEMLLQKHTLNLHMCTG